MPTPLWESNPDRYRKCYHCDGEGKVKCRGCDGTGLTYGRDYFQSGFSGTRFQQARRFILSLSGAF